VLRGQSGQASGEYAGILAVVMIVFVALFASGLAPTVAGAASDAVCTIIGKGCDSGEDPGGGDGGGGPSEGPSPVDFDLPFPVLPFPGSMSVSCSYTSSSPGLCQDAPPASPSAPRARSRSSAPTPRWTPRAARRRRCP